MKCTDGVLSRTDPGRTRGEKDASGLKPEAVSVLANEATSLSKHLVRIRESDRNDFLADDEF